MTFDIQCPNCGTFQHPRPIKPHSLGKSTLKCCPNCGSNQAVSMHHRDDIDQRFRTERKRTE